jgi:hypothetical protein
MAEMHLARDQCRNQCVARLTSRHRSCLRPADSVPISDPSRKKVPLPNDRPAMTQSCPGHVIIRRHQQHEASANDCHPNEFSYEALYVNGCKCFVTQTANHIHRNMDHFPLFHELSLAPSTSNLINCLLSDRFVNFVSGISQHVFQRTNYRRDPPDWDSLRLARHFSLKFGSFSCTISCILPGTELIPLRMMSSH